MWPSFAWLLKDVIPAFKGQAEHDRSFTAHFCKVESSDLQIDVEEASYCWLMAIPLRLSLSRGHTSVRTLNSFSSAPSFGSHQIQHRRRGHNQVCCVSTSDHGRYLDEVALAKQPQRLEELLKVLEVQGQTIVAPDQRSGLHPLVIPLARAPAPQSDVLNSSARGETSYTCLLRWAENSAIRGMPLVCMSANAPGLSLLARSVDEYLHRALAEEDEAAKGQGGPIEESVGPSGQELYQRGSFASSPHKTMPAYLTRSAGMFMDVAEGLVNNHLRNEDLYSGLITSEWYMRPSHFPGWGRPFEFNAQLLRALQRDEEARDSARIALRMPWWTLGSGFETVRSLAKLHGDHAAVTHALSEANMTASGPLPPGVTLGKEPDLAAMDKTNEIMNKVAASEATWDAIRPALAEQYREAGQSGIADFVTAA
ncbi:hypothetical protein WJX74_009152 [Apatococcus lobatus]|uniref:Uncharacterized protein n=1 Tax=Apatococcus lobatus TaxID=904363 RepID=A0AAW1QCA8_9CHLO